MGIWLNKNLVCITLVIPQFGEQINLNFCIDSHNRNEEYQICTKPNGDFDIGEVYDDDA